MEDIAIRLDAEEGVLSGRYVKAGVLSVGKESVRPPYLGQHLVADAQFVFDILGKSQARVMPMLAEVEVHCKVLQQTKWSLEVNGVILYFAGGMREASTDCRVGQLPQSSGLRGKHNCKNACAKHSFIR